MPLEVVVQHVAYGSGVVAHVLHPGPVYEDAPAQLALVPLAPCAVVHLEPVPDQLTVAAVLAGRRVLLVDRVQLDGAVRIHLVVAGVRQGCGVRGLFLLLLFLLLLFLLLLFHVSHAIAGSLRRRPSFPLLQRTLRLLRVRPHVTARGSLRTATCPPGGCGPAVGRLCRHCQDVLVRAFLYS